MGKPRPAPWDCCWGYFSWHNRSYNIRKRRSRGIKPDWPKSVELGKDETPHTAVDIELSDNDFTRNFAFQQ